MGLLRIGTTIDPIVILLVLRSAGCTSVDLVHVGDRCPTLGMGPFQIWNVDSNVVDAAANQFVELLVAQSPSGDFIKDCIAFAT